MVYEVKWNGQAKRPGASKDIIGWHIAEQGRSILNGEAFIPTYDLRHFWGTAYWIGSAETHSFLPALQQFYRELRGDGWREGWREERLDHHGVVINRLEEHRVRLWELNARSLRDIGQYQTSWMGIPFRVEIRTPAGDFGYKTHKAGACQFGIVTAKDVSASLALLVAATDGWQPRAETREQAMHQLGDLEEALREVFTPRLKPAENEPIENGAYENGDGAAALNGTPTAR